MKRSVEDMDDEVFAAVGFIDADVIPGTAAEW